MTSCPAQALKSRRFVADAMLGRLARWLRLLGFDVLYDADSADASLVRICREQDRTLLTRDTRLAVRRGLGHCILISSDHIDEQLLQLRDCLDFSGAARLGRCEECNGELVPATDPAGLRSIVPDHVYRTQPTFVQCRDCGKVYWPGSHIRHFRDRVGPLLGSTRED